MRWFLIICLCYIGGAFGSALWPKGVVHYAINTKDYDQHSRDHIFETISQLQRELCVKFFYTQSNATATDGRFLYITNPDKRLSCPPDAYDFSAPAVEMTVGYHCLKNKKEIARIFVDMLRASIEIAAPVNSFDLEQKFQAQNVDNTSSNLLSVEDRNFINTHYQKECASLDSVPPPLLGLRRSGPGGSTALSPENERYYDKRVWPLGMIMYDFSDSLPIQHANPNGVLPEALATLLAGMVEIMSTTCVVFKKVDLRRDYMVPKNYILFTDDSNDDGVPHLGLKASQSLNVLKFAAESPSFVSHTLNNLLRVAGVPMMSNRYDRDYYVTVNWDNIQSGKEYLLEKAPEDAWIRSLPYDFMSATHAPPDYMLSPDLPKHKMSIDIVQENPQRYLQWMARTGEGLSESDEEILKLIYSKECQKRDRNQWDQEPVQQKMKLPAAQNSSIKKMKLGADTDLEQLKNYLNRGIEIHNDIESSD